jgi:cellulose synthase/poly-beta-1,6-N-acetylglucosamine synthase-like glycosyltransferase
VARTVVDKGLSFVVWCALVAVTYMVAFPTTAPLFAFPYIVFSVYFGWLYFRLLVVPLWALNTLRELERPAQEIAAESDHPSLVVLIAAYKAQGSIASVLQALNHQRYPRDRFRAYVVTQAAENTEKWERFVAVAAVIRRVLHGGMNGTDRSETILAVLARLVGAEPWARPGGATDVLRYAVAGRLLGWASGDLAKRLTKTLLADLCRAHHESHSLTHVWEALADAGLRVDGYCLLLAERLVTCCARRSMKTLADFDRILGMSPGASLFGDPEKPFALAASLAGDGLGTVALRARLFRRIERSIVSWLGAIDKPSYSMRDTIAADAALEARLREAYDAVERTCPEVVDRALESCGPNIHHICRTKVGGGKPESLNTAYSLLVASGDLVVDDDTQIVVIDADSLLHASSLAVVAHEIVSDPDRYAIRQIAPISTSNYPGNNMFVKMICCLDTVGSMGKWARSTRTLDRPDLPAGSGLVIPSVLLEYLRETKGTPWDGTTITEDARLVISDYGLLDGVTRRTKFVPIHLLEAVPEGRSLVDVFRQYWTQRMRWASGGPEELRRLVQQFRAPRAFARARPDRGFHTVALGWRERMIVHLRHLRLLGRWAADHLWWGPGYGLAPLIWLAFAFWYITPPAFKFIGLSLVFGLPGWTVLIVFRRFSRFVPGGLTTSGLLRLYIGTLVLATCHTWPIIYTQFLYLIGREDQFRIWTTTAKPRL